MTDAAQIRACGVAGLPGQVAARAAEATERTAEILLREIPHYRTLSLPEQTEAWGVVAFGFRATTMLWAAGRLATPEELRPFRGNGATRAAQGRPLAAVLRAYRLASLSLFDFVLDIAGDRIDQAEVANLARISMLFVDQLCDEVTLGYVERATQLTAHRERAVRELVEDLLAGRFASAQIVGGRATHLGLSLPESPMVLVVGARSAGPDTLEQRAERLLDELRREHGAAGPDVRPHVVSVVRRAQLVVLLGADLTAGVERLLARHGLHGALAAASETSDVPEAYRRASAMFEFVVRAQVPFRTLVSSEETWLLTRFADAYAAAEPREHEDPIRPLLAPKHDMLRETLTAYVEGGNAVSAAHRLGVHPQTMRYRLRRIRELTGRDPGDGWDRFVLELALRAHAMTAPAPTEPAGP
jgi:hypothetical protein